MLWNCASWFLRCIYIYYFIVFKCFTAVLWNIIFRVQRRGVIQSCIHLRSTKMQDKAEAFLCFLQWYKQRDNYILLLFSIYTSTKAAQSLHPNITLVMNNQANSKLSDVSPDLTMLTGQFLFLSFNLPSTQANLNSKGGWTTCTSCKYTNLLWIWARAAWNSFHTVLLLGDADVDKLHQLPGWWMNLPQYFAWTVFLLVSWGKTGQKPLRNN